MIWKIRGDRLHSTGRFDDAITMYRAALSLEESAQSWKGLAGVYISLGDFEHALEAAAHATTLEPEDSSGLLLHGHCLFSLGRSDDAYAYFSSAARVDPENSFVWFNQAETLMDLGRLRDATAANRRAIELDPDDAGL